MSYYVALGDSMSIDLYPRLDLQGRGRVGPTEAPGVGAASLFHRNHDDLWPDFRGRDLLSLGQAGHDSRQDAPHESGREGGGEAGGAAVIRKLDACVDGATIGSTATLQLTRIPSEVREAARLLTLTAGGNDLLGGLFDGMAGLEGAVRTAMAAYEELVGTLVDSFPAATLLLTTVYDPTDGTGLLPGVSDEIGRLPMHLLETFNDHVRSLAAEVPRAALADAHRHFLGHGLTAPPDGMWYWAPSPIEPGARGASEIRSVWLDALETAGQGP